MLQAVFRAAERTGPPLCFELDEEETLLGCDEFSSHTLHLCQAAEPRAEPGWRRAADWQDKKMPQRRGRDLYPLLNCASVSLLSLERRRLLRGAEAARLAASGRGQRCAHIYFAPINIHASHRRFICALNCVWHMFDFRDRVKDSPMCETIQHFIGSFLFSTFTVKSLLTRRVQKLQ